MRYTVCEDLMWFALAGRSFRFLEAAGIFVDRRAAKRLYREMVARTLEVGSLKENPLRICLSGGMVWLSIYKAVNGSMTDRQFGEMVSDSMQSKLVVASFKVKAKTAFTLEGQQRRARIAAEGAPFSKDNPFLWNQEVVLGRDADEYRINYRQCGLCALGRQENLAHLVKYMCVLDVMSIEWMGGVLYRTKTLATGGDCCDFYICKKGSRWEWERKNECSGRSGPFE